MADPGLGRTYTQEEVNEILKRALRQQSQRGKQLSHAELVEMADEVGIDRESLEAATADLAQSRETELVQSNEARELAEARARLFTRFVSSLFTFLLIGAALYFVSLKTGGNWFFWPVLGFSIALVVQLRAIFFPHGTLERQRRREFKEARRRERREAREAMRNRMRASYASGHAQALDQGTKEFEAAVQAGVAALLSVAAKKIQTHTERANAARSEIEAGVDVRRRSRT
jgi:hypothetical protein